MAYAANRGCHRVQSLSSQHSDWDLISNGEAELLQERLSVASFDSDESDTVIIFGGSLTSGETRTLSVVSSNSNTSVPESIKSWTANSNAVTKNININSNLFLDEQHERLLSAVSGLAKDPALQKVASNFESSPIEDRLLKQITKLAQDLDDSQEQAKTLLDENDKLLSENDKLKSKFLDTESNTDAKLKGTMEVLVRAGISLAVALYIVLQLKRKLLGFNAVSLVAGGCGIYGYLKLTSEKK